MRVALSLHNTASMMKGIESEVIDSSDDEKDLLLTALKQKKTASLRIDMERNSILASKDNSKEITLPDEDNDEYEEDEDDEEGEDKNDEDDEGDYYDDCKDDDGNDEDERILSVTIKKEKPEQNDEKCSVKYTKVGEIVIDLTSDSE